METGFSPSVNAQPLPVFPDMARQRPVSEWLQRYRTYVVLVIGLIAAMGFILFWVNRPQPVPIVISTPIPAPTSTPEPTPTPSPLRVYITGAVKNPDVYILPPNSIVKDAVAAAGGVTSEADLDRINLALQVYDQQQIHVPKKGEAAPPVVAPPPQPDANPPAGKVNINDATVDELDALPGIGPAIAKRIVDYRTANGLFGIIEDLMNVKGIGPATFEKLEDKIKTE